MSRASLGPDDLERVAARLVGTEDPAWPGFVEALWPDLTRLVRASRSMGPLGRSDDHVHDAALRVLERLGSDGCRALRLYPAWRDAAPGRAFGDWLRIVTANVVRDYVREKVGRPTDGARVETTTNKRLVDSLAEMLPTEDDLGTRPPLTAYHTAREVLAYARDHLPAAQLDALGGWLGGETFDEIAAKHELPSADAASKLVRAALAVLRRRVEGPG